MKKEHPLLLAIDIGNTNIVLGVYQALNLVGKWRISTTKGAGADEYYVLISRLLKDKIGSKPLAATLICSVVPDLTAALWEATKKIGCENIFEVTGATNLNMAVKIDDASELGADRLVNSYAAFLKHQQAAIVIDFGTATTFDVISSRGEYLGGIISTGLKLSLTALVQHAANLSRVKLQVPPQVIGKNTTASMQSGLMFGYAAMCDGLVDKISLELSTTPIVLATGGLAKIMHKISERIEYVDEDLTIWGLANIYNQFFAVP